MQVKNTQIIIDKSDKPIRVSSLSLVYEDTSKDDIEYWTRRLDRLGKKYQVLRYERCPEGISSYTRVMYGIVTDDGGM